MFAQHSQCTVGLARQELRCRADRAARDSQGCHAKLPHQQCFSTQCSSSRPVQGCGPGVSAAYTHVPCTRQKATSWHAQLSQVLPSVVVPSVDAAGHAC